MKIIHMSMLVSSLFFFNGVFSANGNKMIKTTEVLVIGGTTSGISAGIQSARLNVQTLIVEETPWLGGMLTSAGVSATDGNHQLRSGIWNEFYTRLCSRYGGEAALSTGWVSNTQFEPHIGDSIFKAMAAAEQKLTLIYGFYLTGVIRKGTKVTGAVFENKEQCQLIVHAKIVIDASDLGDGLAMAGCDFDLGMEAKSTTGEENAPEQANDIVQDLTWAAILKDYGPGTDHSIKKPEGYNPELFRGSCSMTVDSIAIDCDRMLSYGRLPNNKFMINWPRHGNDFYLNVIALNRDQRQRELQKAKERTLGFVYYIQNELGFKNLGLADDEFPTADRLPFVPYHREGRRLRGIQRLTITHIRNIYGETPIYRTGVSVGDYPVDHHHACNPDAPKLRFPAVPSFNIPAGALIPEKIDGLIVSDKAISVSNIVNGATRLQPVVLLTGQAAGAMAALSVVNHTNVRDINIRQLQQALLDAGAFLLPLTDVKAEDKDFQAIQRIAASGILKVKGESWKWANRTWFYPDSTLTIKEFTGGLGSFDSRVKQIQNDSLLTILKASEILSAYTRHESMPAIKIIWQDKMNRKPDVKQNITKRELSVIADELIRPFSGKPIGFDGNYY